VSHLHRFHDEAVRVAAVQASPEYLDKAATVEKACRLVREAADEGAALVAFPETYVPGYPYWNWVNAPIDGYDWYERYRRESVDVPGPEVERLRSVADETDDDSVTWADAPDGGSGTVHLGDKIRLGGSVDGRFALQAGRLTLIWHDSQTGETTVIATYPIEAE